MKKDTTPPSGVKLYAVGKIVGCFGVKGFVKLQMFTRIVERYAALRAVYIGESEATARPSVVQSIEAKHKGVVIKFESIEDRSSAEKVVGMYLFVDEEHFERPGQGSYLIDEVIGCEVIDTDGKYIGIVKEIYALPAHDLWEVQRPSGLAMLPAVKEFIREVDLQKRKIIVRLIDGLIEGV